MAFSETKLKKNITYNTHTKNIYETYILIDHPDLGRLGSLTPTELGFPNTSPPTIRRAYTPQTNHFEIKKSTLVP